MIKEWCLIILVHGFFDGSDVRRDQDYEIQVHGDRITSAHVSNDDLVLAGTQLKRRKYTSCKTLDLRKSFVLPGLNDLHTHLFSVDKNESRNFSKELIRITAESSEKRVEIARRNARSLLRAGITSIRDLGNSGNYLEKRIDSEYSGKNSDLPRIFFSGPGIAIQEGQFEKGTPLAIVNKEYSVISNVSQAEQIVLDHLKNGATWIKIYADNDPNSSIMPQPWIKQLARIAHQNNLKVAVHATQIESIINAASAGIDSLEHGYAIDSSAAQLINANKIAWVPTFFSLQVLKVLSTKNPDYKDQEGYIKNRLENIRTGLKYNLNMAFGSDAYVDWSKIGISPGKASKEGLYAYVDYGLTPLQALFLATSKSGALLSPGNIGALKPGYFADFIAVNGDPTKNIRDLENITFVFKSGRIICGAGDPCMTPKSPN